MWAGLFYGVSSYRGGVGNYQKKCNICGGNINNVFNGGENISEKKYRRIVSPRKSPWRVMAKLSRNARHNWHHIAARKYLKGKISSSAASAWQAW
jgi:hypothetical protein